MVSIFIRILIVYFTLLVFLRLLGKRQLGEMELSEFLVASLIADMAANPLQDIGMPLLNGLLPIMTLICCEIMISTLSMRSIRLRSFLFGKPSLLIEHGQIRQKEMNKNRFTLDELLQELRSLGVRDIASIEYAFLETNGKLSVLQYAAQMPPIAAELNITAENRGFPRILISDGRLIRENLQKSGYTESWLSEQLRPYGGRIEDIFLLTVDDAAHVYCAQKEGKP